MTKLNTDGWTRGQPGTPAYEGVFCMSRGFIKGSFSMPLGVQIALFVELIGLIRDVELAIIKDWFLLWIDTDSLVLVSKVKSHLLDVPWRLRPQWKKCLKVLYEWQFSITHIYRERNKFDIIPNVGLALTDFTW